MPRDASAQALQPDTSAIDRLFARYLPRLSRFAHGRLPPWARDGIDTQDLVQEALLRTFKQIERFEPRREGASVG